MIAALLAGLLIVVGFVIWIVGEESGRWDRGSADKGRYAKAPDACTVLSDYDIEELLVKPVRGTSRMDVTNSTCNWQETPPSPERPKDSLKVELTRVDGTDGATATQAAHQVFIRNAAPGAPINGFDGTQKDIPSLGNEARLIGKVGITFDDKYVDRSYSLWIRVENLIAHIEYGKDRAYHRKSPIDIAADDAAEQRGELLLGPKLVNNLLQIRRPA